MRRSGRILGATGALLTAAAAVAVPLAGPATPAAAAALASCAARSDQAGPVRITVLSLEPHTIRPGDRVRVQAVLLNCGGTPLTGLRVRLRTGAELITRTDLTQADTRPLAERVAAPWQDLPEPLAAGRAVRVPYQATVAELGLTSIGVYPVDFVVQVGAAEQADRAQVGVVRSYLPYFPEGVAAPTEVSWLLPFADRPHRLYDAGPDTAGPDTRQLIDDRLTGLLDGNGRLNRLLTVAENASAAEVPFALALDPDLIDTVHAMTLGYQVQVGSRRVEGTGQQVATMWLNRLIGLAARHDVFALPYADADLVALSRSRLPELAQTRPETLKRLADQVHAPVRTQVAWPAGGLLTDQALDAVVSQGAQAVVLDAAALPNAPVSTRTQSAPSPLPSANGTAVALVPDAGLARLVGGAVPVAGGPRLAEQRYLAELAMITAEAPSVRRRILVAPPHDWSPNPDAASRMLQDTRRLSWLTAGSVTGVTGLARSHDLVPRGALSYPRGTPELSRVQILRIHKLQELLEQFRRVLDNVSANTVLERFNHALQRTASAFWRTAPGAPPGDPTARAGTVFLNPIANRIKSTVQDQVYIVRPQDGKYSLASQNSALPLTVVNNLDVPVRIRVQISSQGMVGFHAGEMPATLAGGKRTLLRIPATVTQSGRFQLTAVLLTPDGHRLSAPVTLTVQSTAYGVVTLTITGTAFGLLLVLLARRLVRWIRSGPGALVQPAGSPAERAS